MAPEGSEFEGLASLRAAFEALENGRRVAESADSEGSNGTLKSILRWRGRCVSRRCQWVWQLVCQCVWVPWFRVVWTLINGYLLTCCSRG